VSDAEQSSDGHFAGEHTAKEHPSEEHPAGEHRHEPPTDEEYSVSPLELFFDLVFVFAFTQVTALLADDLTWTGLVRATTLLVIVWWAWVGYSWLTNAVRVDDIIPARIVVFAAMGAGLVMGLAIPQAFGDHGVLFGFSYSAVTGLFLLLYFVSTLGSAVGTLATSFYLVLWLDVDQILWGLCAVSWIIGGLGLVVPEREHAFA